MSIYGPIFALPENSHILPTSRSPPRSHIWTALTGAGAADEGKIVLKKLAAKAGNSQGSLSRTMTIS